MTRGRAGMMASMGPGCFHPGNELCEHVRAQLTELQWGRDVSIPEMLRRAFMLLSPRARFNGAGMFLSRKCCGAPSCCYPHALASMGPGCFYPGNIANCSRVR